MLNEDNNDMKEREKQESRGCGQKVGWQSGRDKGRRGIVESKEGIHDSQWERAEKKKVLL